MPIAKVLIKSAPGGSTPWNVLARRRFRQRKPLFTLGSCSLSAIHNCGLRYFSASSGPSAQCRFRSSYRRSHWAPNEKFVRLAIASRDPRLGLGKDGVHAIVGCSAAIGMRQRFPIAANLFFSGEHAPLGELRFGGRECGRVSADYGVGWISHERTIARTPDDREEHGDVLSRREEPRFAEGRAFERGAVSAAD